MYQDDLIKQKYSESDEGIRRKRIRTTPTRGGRVDTRRGGNRTYRARAGYVIF